MIQRRGAVGEQHVFLQQPQRPPVITGRGFRARQGDHPRLDLPRHLRLHQRRRPLPPADHILGPTGALGEPLRDQIHRALRDPGPLGDHPPIRNRTDGLVQLQQNPGPGNHPSRMRPPRHHPRQLHPVTSTQRDDMILRPGHDSDSSRSSINREQPTSNTNQIKGGTLLDCVDYRGNRHVGVFNPTPATMREPFVDAVVEHLTNGLAHDGVVTTARLDERITRS